MAKQNQFSVEELLKLSKQFNLGEDDIENFKEVF